MPKTEFFKWMAYYRHKKADIQETQMALLMSIVSNAMGGKTKLDDFLITKSSSKATNKVSNESLQAMFSTKN